MEATVHRSVLFLIFLLLPGVPLAAQHAGPGSPMIGVSRMAPVVPKWAGAGTPRLVSGDLVRLPVASHSPLLDASRTAPRSCPARTRRTAGGAALGLLLGGAIGYAHGSAGHPGLPHTGLDIPDEWEYTPFFALAGAIAGGIVGARTARCP
jgi:hypothetical protein